MIIDILFKIHKEDKLHNPNTNQEQDTFHQRIQTINLHLAKILEINFKDNRILHNLIINNNLINLNKFHLQLWINSTLII
jgi:hypothetical protein